MNVEVFDRESRSFADYLVPQIYIKLNLRCDSLLAAASDFSAQSESLASDEILYSKTGTNLHIIIVDVNDQIPVFTNPPSDNFMIGYPDIALGEQLKPANLIQIEAFDLDEGMNAKIKFSLESYEDFTINSESGVVYPLKGCMQNDENVTITVRATDLDGLPGGKRAETSLIVVKIRAENVVEFNIENALLENVPTVISDLSQSSEIDLRLINYFAVPTASEVKSRQSSGDSKIIVYAYAFNNSRSLLNSGEIIEILSQSEVDISIAFSQFNDNHRRKADCSLTGLIVAVSILGGVLLIISIATPLVWFLWLRYKVNDSSRRNSTAIAKTSLEEDFETQSEEISPPIPAVEISNVNETYQNDAEILGIQIDGVTQGEMTTFNTS